MLLKGKISDISTTIKKLIDKYGPINVKELDKAVSECKQQM